MSKRHDKTGRSKGEPRHVRLYYWMLNSAAWQSLSVVARCEYVEMAMKYAGPGSNNGRIGYSVRDAAKSLRIGKSTAARGLAILQECGFIVPMQKGSFDYKLRHATEWRLTQFPCDVSGQPASNDFMRWQPEDLETGPAMDRHGTRAGTERYLQRDRPPEKWP